MQKNNHKVIDEYLKSSSSNIMLISKHKKELLKIINSIISVYKKKQKIYACGNGGSDAEAEHFVTELLCTFENRKRKPISAISLNSSSSSLSAWSNDFNYKSFLERSVIAHCNKGDILFILTTSGGSKEKEQSKNIILAAKAAKKKGAKIISLTGKKGGEIKKFSDICIHIKNNNTSFIQEAHLVIIHLICIFLDKKI